MIGGTTIPSLRLGVRSKRPTIFGIDKEESGGISNSNWLYIYIFVQMTLNDAEEKWISQSALRV